MDDSITLEELLDLIVKRVRPSTGSDISAFRLSAISDARPKEVRVLDIEGLETYISLSCSSIYELMDKDGFPKVIRLSKNRVGWLIDEIDSWIDNRREQRDNPKTALPG